MDNDRFQDMQLSMYSFVYLFFLTYKQINKIEDKAKAITLKKTHTKECISKNKLDKQKLFIKSSQIHLFIHRYSFFHLLLNINPI